MDATRREFFKRMGLVGGMAVTTLAALALDDPERLLWVPGQKTIFLPEPKKVALATPEQIGAMRAGQRPVQGLGRIDDRRYQFLDGHIRVTCDSGWQMTDAYDQRDGRILTKAEREQLADSIRTRESLKVDWANPRGGSSGLRSVHLPAEPGGRRASRRRTPAVERYVSEQERIWADNARRSKPKKRSTRT